MHEMIVISIEGVSIAGMLTLLAALLILAFVMILVAELQVKGEIELFDHILFGDEKPTETAADQTPDETLTDEQEAQLDLIDGNCPLCGEDIDTEDVDWKADPVEWECDNCES